MIQKVFGIRDSKAKAFLQPFFSTTIEAALRAFGDAVGENKGSPLSKHPEDYILYELADFNDLTGEFVVCAPVKMLGTGSDFGVSRETRVPLMPDLEAVGNGK